MNRLILITSFLVGIFHVGYATEITFTHKSKKHLQIKVVRVEMQSDYLSPLATAVFDLMEENGLIHTIVCNEKIERTSSVKRSYLKYQNIARVEVGQFEISANDSCQSAADYVEKIFEFIDDDNPITIRLNTRKKLVQKVIFPNLDLYLNQLPGIEPIEDKEDKSSNDLIPEGTNLP